TKRIDVALVKGKARALPPACCSSMCALVSRSWNGQRRMASAFGVGKVMGSLFAIFLAFSLLASEQPFGQFTDSILERPYDDAPRLALADSLEESGDARRADFIRLQIKLSQMVHSHPDRRLLEQRERTLLPTYGLSFHGPELPGLFFYYRGLQ